MGLFSRRRKSEDCTGLHADATGTAVARVGSAMTRRPVLRASAFQPGDGETPDASTINELAKTISATGNDLNIVLSHRDYQLLLVEAPQVDPDELRSAIRWRVKDLIDFHIDDAVFDAFAVPGQQNRPRGQVPMYAVAARASRIQAVVDQINESSLNLMVIDIQELAMRNLAALTDHDGRGTVMVQLDAAGGRLTITQQRELYMTRQLDLDISESDHQPDPETSEPEHQPDPETSEPDYQLDMDTSDSDRQPDPETSEPDHQPVPETSEPSQTELALFERLLLEIQRSIDYYGSHFGQPPPVGLSIMPGFEHATALAEWLNDQLDQTVEVFDITRHMECEATPDADGIDQRLIAIGGALRREEVTL